MVAAITEPVRKARAGARARTRCYPLSATSTKWTLGERISRDPLGEKAFQIILLLDRKWIVRLPLSFETILEDYLTPPGFNGNSSDLPMLQESDVLALLDKVFNQQHLSFAFNNPISVIDLNGREPISITAGSIVIGGAGAAGVGVGVAVGVAFGAGAVVGTAIADVGVADWFARMATRWSCTATCHHTPIPPNCSCNPPFLSGFGSGPTRGIACLIAIRNATGSASRGCYGRHCQCPRCWRN